MIDVKWINKVTNSIVIKNIFVVLWVCVCIFPILLSIFKSGIDCDSAYYICVAERISEGYIPYVNLKLVYTPLWFYIEAMLKIIFQIPSGLYWPYLLLFYIIQISTAYFLYRFLICISTKQSIAFFGSGLFLLIIHWINGNTILLEVPALFFGILGCWLAVEWKDKKSWLFILVGVFSSCSFLAKQYGAGFLVLILYIVLFISKRRDIKTILIYLLGYIIPIFLCFLFFGEAFVTSVIFNGYGTDSAFTAGYDISATTKLMQILKCIKFHTMYVCPATLVAILFLYEAWKQKRIEYLIFAYCGILGFSLQFYFSDFHHYMIFLVPFDIIIITELLSISNCNKWIRYVKNFAIIIVVLITIYKTYYNRVWKLYVKRDIRAEQQILARQVKRDVGKDKTLYIINTGLYYLYFMADIQPPNMKEVGYSFGPFGLNKEQCLKQINAADYVIRYNYDDPYESFFTDSIQTILQKNPIIKQYKDCSVLLYKMQEVDSLNDLLD